MAGFELSKMVEDDDDDPLEVEDEEAKEDDEESGGPWYDAEEDEFEAGTDDWSKAPAAIGKKDEVDEDSAAAFCVMLACAKA